MHSVRLQFLRLLLHGVFARWISGTIGEKEKNRIRRGFIQARMQVPTKKYDAMRAIAKKRYYDLARQIHSRAERTVRRSRSFHLLFADFLALRRVCPSSAACATARAKRHCAATFYNVVQCAGISISVALILQESAESVTETVATQARHCHLHLYALHRLLKYSSLKATSALYGLS